MPNKNLHAAKTAKNDEFYTQLSDIEKELYHYRDFFRGKEVFCNCDDPEYSNFWKYFQMNFFFLGLKKLIATHYEPGKQSYKMEIIAADLPSGQTAFPDYVKTPLEGDGDFRSDECIEILKEADVVVTNPPFSLFREYVAQLMEYDKKFIIIGNINAITYKEFFPLLKDDKVWPGWNEKGGNAQRQYNAFCSSPRLRIQKSCRWKRWEKVCSSIRMVVYKHRHSKASHPHGPLHALPW